ncbi:MAG: bifunctional 5,10-methylenetetrahydrofolate dehydrogenase/5,10-methenyltetrahydrofolate cyclohydrolase [Patescibacteria group bacterium]|jgi:methylenetetrahydrofolate dehydrogenase (NADP+)/methenyltetrahydrofolate cyclohydrolase
MNLIDGKTLAEEIQQDVRKRIEKAGITPGLAIILVGDNEASKLYVRLKERAAHAVGIACHTYRFNENTAANEILTAIDFLNKDEDVHGIIVQLPLPRHLSEDAIIKAMDFRKDVDGFHPKNVEAMLKGLKVPEPTLIKAILRLLKNVKVNIKGKKVVVLANSPVFLNPFIHLLTKKGADARAFRKGERFEAALAEADILITAYGKPESITGRMLKEGVTIIDVGITKLEDGSVVGDVDVESLKDKAEWITPVPGGVGPVTVATLLENTLESALRFKNE